MKNVFKYLGTAVLEILNIVSLIRKKRAKSLEQKTTDLKLKTLYEDSGFELTDSALTQIRPRAEQILHFAEVIVDYYHGQRSTDDWFVRRFAHFANLNLTLHTFLAAQLAKENFDEAVYSYIEDMEEHQVEFDKISQL